MELYPRPKSVLLAARRNNHRLQQIYIDSRARPARRLQLKVSVTPVADQGVWHAPATTTVALQTPLRHVQPGGDRRELWQDTNPTRTSLHRALHRRRRARTVGHPRGHSLRKDLSKTLLSAYSAARAPFHGHRKRKKGVDAAIRETRRRTVRPPVSTTSTNTVEISGPLSSPAPAAASLPLARKFFKHRRPRRSASSPLSLSTPIMPFRASMDAGLIARNSDPPALRYREMQRSRDSFNRAKVHVRRPPKGIKHWFEALEEDSSDEDYPEVVEAQPVMSAPPGMTTFQPSLGPQRARAAPTSFVSGSVDSYADYFSYRRANRRRKNSSVENDNAATPRLGSEDPHMRSILDLSSDDEGQSPAQSPAGWDVVTPSPGAQSLTFLRRTTMPRKGSAATPTWTPGQRQSMASMQTTLTSATIPFMLRISPVTDGATPPRLPIHRHHASYLALTGRPPTADGKSFVTQSPSIRQSDRSAPSTGSLFSAEDSSNRPSAAQHYVAVTAEEMELIEMIRRKKAANTPDLSSIFKRQSMAPSSIVEEPESPISIPAPLNLQRKSDSTSKDNDQDTIRTKSLASTVMLDTGEVVTFPIPGDSPRSSQKIDPGTITAKPMHLGGMPTPPPTASYWSPEVPTPQEEVSELEAIPFVPPALPLRCSALGSNPPAKRRSSHVSALRARIFNGANVTPLEAPVLRPTFTTTSTSAFSSSSDSTAAAMTSSTDSPSKNARESHRGPIRQQSVATSAGDLEIRSPGLVSPRRTRTYDEADTYNLLPELNMDFSDFQLLPLPNHFSSSTFILDNVVTNQESNEDVVSPVSIDGDNFDTKPRSESVQSAQDSVNKDKSLPPLPPATPILDSEPPRHAETTLADPFDPSHLLPDEPDFACDDEDDDDDDSLNGRSTSSSRSPSLTDGGSLSGHSRSEIDTPVKESGMSAMAALPRILLGGGGGNPRFIHHPTKAGGLDESDGSLTLVREETGPELVETVGLGAEGEAVKRRPSDEVLAAWRGLGGYEVR